MRTPGNYSPVGCAGRPFLPRARRRQVAPGAALRSGSEASFLAGEPNERPAGTGEMRAGMAVARRTNRMKTVELDAPQRLPVKPENIISIPLGLLGFESVKKYVLLGAPEEEPFLWFQMLDNPNQGFVVVPPATVIPHYTPDISEADVEFLGIRAPGDAIVLNIVTV